MTDGVEIEYHYNGTFWMITAEKTCDFMEGEAFMKHLRAIDSLLIEVSMTLRLKTTTFRMTFNKDIRQISDLPQCVKDFLGIEATIRKTIWWRLRNPAV